MGAIGNVQERVRSGTSTVLLIAVKIFVAFFFGLTFTLIGDQVLDYGWFSFILVLVVLAAALLRIMRSWGWSHVGIFTLICVLIGLLLRMYILIAPG